MKIPDGEMPATARAFAVGGALAFVASLGYFLYSYDITFGRDVETTDLASSVAWDVGLFSAFALHHSVFARERVRAWVARTWRSLERSVYVWVASLLLIATCYFWRAVPGVLWDIGGPAAWAVRALQLLGIWLAVRSAVIIDVWELAGIRGSGLGARESGSRTSNSMGISESGSRIPDPGAEFKLVGPYSWVRHPIYLGWFLIVFAVSRMTMTQMLFAAVGCAYVLIAIPLEERSLRRTSGGAYERYMHRVRWKLIPHVF
jgi:methanethiol S-methyltransferase